MKSCLVLLMVFYCALAISQGNATLSPFQKKNAKALVIGISNYQHIKGLRFADRDAVEFANFLKENDAWGLQEENIQVLTNENARQGDILTGLQWLLDVTESGEDVIFYFSGHGDVEQVGEDKKGFLLAQDSPKNNYPICGTLEVSLLDSVLVQLMNRDAKVWVLIDACRSGNLAGGLSGMQQTTEALAKQWNNQIRILSAQPDQLSYEDPKWGGGRGVFSYFLVKGMSGYANANPDQKITLNELESYLGNNITLQTEYAQQPHVEGPNPFSLSVSKVDSLQMQRYINDQVEGEVSLAMVPKAGEYTIAEECRIKADELTLALKEGLSSDRFHAISKMWHTLNGCLKNDVPPQIRYAYSRALINQINKVVNYSLTGEKLRMQQELRYGIQLIGELDELNNGRHFLGKDHFERVNNYLKAIILNHYTDVPLNEQRLPYLLEVQQSDPEFYMWNDSAGFQNELDDFTNNVKVLNSIEGSRGSHTMVFLTEFNFTDNVLSVLNNYLEGAIKLSVLIDRDTLVILDRHSSDENPKRYVNQKNFDEKYSRLLQAKLSMDCVAEPDAAYLYYARASLYSHMKGKDSALLMLDSCIRLSPKWLNPLYAKGAILRSMGRNNEAIQTFEEVFELDSIYQDFECVDCFFMGLVNLYLKKRNYDKIDPAIERWMIMRKDRKSKWDLYYQLFIDRNAKRSQKNFWLKKMKTIQQINLSDQFSWINAYLEMHPHKYSDRELLEFSGFLIDLMAEGDDAIRTFFEHNTFKRSELTNNSFIVDFFPDGKSFTFIDSFTLIEDIAWLVSDKYYSHFFIRKELEREYFMLAGLLRMKNLEWYHGWAMRLVYKGRNEQDLFYQCFFGGPYENNLAELNELRLQATQLETSIKKPKCITKEALEQTKINVSQLNNRIAELQYTDAAYNYALFFDFNPEDFLMHYAPLYPKDFFLQFMNSLDGEMGWQDENVLRSKCKTFEDQENLKKIQKLMEEFYRWE